MGEKELLEKLRDLLLICVESGEAKERSRIKDLLLSSQADIAKNTGADIETVVKIVDQIWKRL